MIQTIFFDLECAYDDMHKQDLSILVDRYWDKTDFMPEVNKIITICVGYFKGWRPIVKNIEGEEPEQIKEFFKIASKYNLCGFNIKNFDIPFIIKRAVFYWIKIPNELKIYWKKPWELDNIIDLQEVYRCWVYSGLWDLDTVCKHLWIISPKAKWMSWKDVQIAYSNLDENSIINYCKRDVASCITLYKRFQQLNLI